LSAPRIAEIIFVAHYFIAASLEKIRLASWSLAPVAV
jgi:hypothetical protein